MADMIGADPNELRNLAAQMRGAADELDGHSSALTSLLGSVDWVGDFASRFLSSWSGGHRVRLQSTSQFIRDAASELERNADEQVNASNSAGSGRGFAGGGGGGGGGGGWSFDDDVFDDVLDLVPSILDGADVILDVFDYAGPLTRVLPVISLGLGLSDTFDAYQAYGWASEQFANSALDTVIGGVLSFTPAGPFWAGGNLVSQFLTGQSIVDNVFDDPLSMAMIWVPGPWMPVGLYNLVNNADNSPAEWLVGEISDFVGF